VQHLSVAQLGNVLCLGISLVNHSGGKAMRPQAVVTMGRAAAGSALRYEYKFILLPALRMLSLLLLSV
jgi:hypothetical protein